MIIIPEILERHGWRYFPHSGEFQAPDYACIVNLVDAYLYDKLLQENKRLKAKLAQIEKLSKEKGAE